MTKIQRDEQEHCQSQEEKLKAVIREMLAQFVGADNGYCTVCHGHRHHKQPCESRSCPSRTWEAAIQTVQEAKP